MEKNSDASKYSLNRPSQELLHEFKSFYVSRAWRILFAWPDLAILQFEVRPPDALEWFVNGQAFHRERVWLESTFKEEH